MERLVGFPSCEPFRLLYHGHKSCFTFSGLWKCKPCSTGLIFTAVRLPAAWDQEQTMIRRSKQGREVRNFMDVNYCQSSLSRNTTLRLVFAQWSSSVLHTPDYEKPQASRRFVRAIYTRNCRCVYDAGIQHASVPAHISRSFFPYSPLLSPMGAIF